MKAAFSISNAAAKIDWVKVGQMFISSLPNDIDIFLQAILLCVNNDKES
jgi:hypothetical protein